MFEDLTLFAMAQRSLAYLARREAVLSENIANANTPKYQAKDLAPLEFKTLVAPVAPVQAAATSPLHIVPAAAPATFEEVTTHNPSESKPDGNDVQIEEQMREVGQVKGKYTLAVNLLMKNIEMLRTALDRNAPSA